MFFKKISSKNRAIILRDLFALAEAKQLPYENVLNLLMYMGKEKEYLPWLMALNGLNTIKSYFDEKSQLKNYNVISILKI